MHVHTSDTSASPATLTARIVMIAAVTLTALLAIIGLALLWPGSAASGGAGQQSQPGLSTAVVTAVDAAACTSGGGSDCAFAQATMGSTSVRVALPSESLADLPSVGDRIRVVPGSTASQMVFVDYDRTVPLGLLAALCGLAVVAVAYFKGLRALIGLVFAFAIVLFFMLPAILGGKPAMLVGLTASAAILLVVMYVAHGFSMRTTAALLGTEISLGITAVLGVLMTERAHLNVKFDDDAYVLSAYHHLSSSDVVVCAILIAAIGVLTDVTITQVSALWELAQAQPRVGRSDLFTAIMRIGRDHIASSVYTVAFVLVGGALASLLVVSASGRPVVEQLLLGQQAVEVATILVCLTGTVLAVPLTTALAAVSVPRERTAVSRARAGHGRH